MLIEGVVRMSEQVDVHMRDSDAFSWYMEDDPLLRSTVVSVFVLERAPDWPRLEERLERASRQTPGLRHKVVEAPMRLATPRWVVDPDFDLSWHVRRFQVAPPRDLASVLDHARRMGMAGFDRDRPLWEYTFLEGLDDGRCAVVMKLHHSLTDGVGGMELARLLFDVEPDPGDLGPMPPAPSGEHLGTVELARDALAYDWSRLFDFARHRLGAAPGDLAQVLRHPVTTAGDLLETARSVGRTVEPANDTLSPVMTERHLSWHYDVVELPLDELRAAAKSVGCSLNDGFLAGIGGGLHRYHERHGADVDELRLTMPISIRKADDPIGGNRITLQRFRVPIGVEDPVARMQAVHERCASVRSEKSLPLTNAIAGTLNLLPRGVVGGMLKHVDFLASNVPGIPVPLYLGGACVERFYPFGPTIGAALNVTLLSYCGTCFVGVNCDSGAVPDPDQLMDDLRVGFDDVLAVGGTEARSVLPARAG